MIGVFIICLSLGIVAFILKAIHAKKGRPPGPLPLPFINHDYLGFGDMPVNFRKLHEKYGPIIEVTLMNIPTISIADPDLIREIVKNDAFISRPFIQSQGMKVLGIFENGVGMNNDLALWRKSRGVFLAAISSADFLERAAFDMAELLNDMFFPQFAGKTKSGEVINMLEFAEDFVLKFLEQSMFNKIPQMHIDDHEFKSYVVAFMNAFTFYMTTPPALYDLLGGNKHKIALGKFYDYQRSVIASRKAELEKLSEQERTQAKDLIAIVLREAERFSSSQEVKELGVFDDENVREIINEVLMGAMDTLVNTISMIAWHIAHNQETQEKLRIETKQFMKKNPIPGRDVFGLPVLEAFLAETFRYLPPVNLIPKAAGKDAKIGPFEIKKFSTIFLCTERMSKNEQFIPEPNVFDIDRFLTGKNGGIEAKHMFPFGIGKRSCPGQSLGNLLLRVFLVHFASKFKVTPARVNDGKKLKTAYRISQHIHEDSTKVHLERA
jgi:cytochrome P450